MCEALSMVPTTISLASMQSSFAYTVVGEALRNIKYHAGHYQGSIVQGVVACMVVGLATGVHVDTYGVVGGAS